MFFTYVSAGNMLIAVPVQKQEKRPNIAGPEWAERYRRKTETRPLTENWKNEVNLFLKRNSFGR